MFKKLSGIETPNALREKENEEGVSPSLAHQEIRRSIIASPVGSGSEPWLKTKTILVHFVPEKPTLVNRSLLNVVKSCITKLLK